MAMNSVAMANAVIAAIKAATTPWFNPDDDNRLTYLDYDTYLDVVWKAACAQIVAHIQANAQAVGSDAPSGDTHFLNIT